jgi:PilZ domain
MRQLSLSAGVGMKERRKEIRYGVPEIYQKYVTFKIRKDPGEFVPVELLDFSLYGIKMKDSFVWAVDSPMECVISAPKSLTREIPFSAKVKYCIQNEQGEGYLIGAEIIQNGDHLWLNIFSKVHDYINEKIGDIF